MTRITNKSFQPHSVGLIAVIEELELRVPLPAVRSTVAAGARKTRAEGSVVYEQYPKSYVATGLFENLKFAMRYEPVDLMVLQAAFEKIAPEMGNKDKKLLACRL